MWRLIYGIPTWILFEIINIPLMLLGWVFIPIAAITGAYGFKASRFWPEKQILSFNWPWLDYIWGNEEDGIGNGAQYHDTGTTWKQIIYWSALRNPTNNMRFIPILSLIPNPAKVGYVGSGGHPLTYDKKPPRAEWFFAWCGIYTGFFWQFYLGKNLKRFWIGWKIFPEDMYEGMNTGYRKFGAGFALQFKTVS